MKTMPETRNKPAPVGAPPVDNASGIIRSAGGINLAVKLDRLFAGTTVNVAQHVHGAGHGGIQWQTACNGHSGRRNRRCLRSMIDRGNQCRFQKRRLAVAWQITAHHQPDHLGETDRTDQVFDGAAANRDRARRHVDDLGTPPVGDISHITPSLLNRSMSVSFSPISLSISALC
jgi:hypothetical protein